MTLMVNNISNNFKYKKKDKIYVEYDTKDIFINKLSKRDKIYIRELLPNKNSLKEAKKARL